MRATVAAFLAVAALAVPPAPAQRDTNPAHRAAVFLARDVGSRPAASAAERRAHRWVRRRFRAAGLAVTYTRFAVPRRGRSRNVIGAFRGEDPTCLKIVMAHTDSVPEGPGAVDNASGVGVVAALAARLYALEPPCDVWLVATGAEERPYTGTPDHLGASALVRHLQRRKRADDLRYALSLDMVGRGRRFWLRSPRGSRRDRVEREVLAAGRRRKVGLRWVRDSSTGNSDHREFELLGFRALVLQAWQGRDACYHAACDDWRRLQPAALQRVQDVVESVLRRP